MTLSSEGLSVFNNGKDDSVSLARNLSLADLCLTRAIGKVEHNDNTLVLADITDTVISLNPDTLAVISRFPSCTNANILWVTALTAKHA